MKLQGCVALTKKEEQECYDLMLKGKEAKHKLVMSCTAFALSFCHGNEELEGEALLLLTQFVDRYFDPTRGRLTMLVALCLPAKLRAKQRMDESPVRLPSAAGNPRQINPKFKRKYRAGKLELKEDHTVLYRPNVEAQVEKKELIEKMKELFSTVLSEREQDILHSRSVGITLVALAVRYGVTRERIRQIETAALNKLREKLI